MNMVSFRLTALLLVALSALHLRAEPSGGPATLTIKNLPAYTRVIINNASIKNRENDVFTVEPGPVFVQVDYNGVAAYTSSFKVAPGENRTIVLDCQEHCGTLDVMTDPFGASVSLNSTFEGLTPYVNSFLKQGEYSLNVSMPGYVPVLRTVSMEEGKPAMMTLNLEHTQTFRDSIAVAKRAQKRSRQFVQKLVFGGCAAVCAAGGLFFDNTAKSSLSQANDAAIAYDQAQGNFQQYHDTYNTNRDSAKKALNRRDLLYIAAGVCAIGFTFSFLF
jgi:hypothetical protein